MFSRLVHAVRAKLCALLRSNRVEQDLQDELAFHLAMQQQSNESRGLDPGEAERRAKVSFGGVEVAKELSRDARPLRWARTLIQDSRYAVRSLRRSGGFTMTAVLSLAIGIGANAAIFSLVDQVLLSRLPVKEPDRLVLVDWRGPQFSPGMGSGNLVSYPLCRDLQAQTRFFDGVFCRFPTSVALVTGGDPQPVAAEIVSGTYFPVLGIRPALGRLIDPSDDVQPGAHPVVVLSENFWRTKFGAAHDVVGRTVLINNFPMTVIGVADGAFYGVDVGEVPALWIPTMMAKEALAGWDHLLDRRMRWMHVFGRLAPGVTAESAQAGLQPWFKQMLQSDMTLEGFPKISPTQRAAFLASTIDVMPASRGRSNLRNSIGGPLTVLMVGTLLLYLLASANVAGLFLARASARVREIQTRIALGASRGRVTSMLVVDSLLVAFAGGLVGLLLAPVVSNLLIAFLPDNVAGVHVTSRSSGHVFAFAFLASLVTGALSGLGLAWQAGRIPLMSTLKTRAGTTGGVRLRKAFVIGQMAFTLILLVGAGLFVQTLERLYAKGPGISTTHLLTFGINLTSNGLTLEEQDVEDQKLLAAFRGLPGVESAAISGFRLLDGGSWNNSLTIDAGRRITTDGVVHLNPVSPGFFATMGTSLVEGRDFDNRDRRPVGLAGERSAIVNERFARRYFGDRSPIGHRIGIGTNPDTPTDIEIIGVVKDFSYRNLREESEQMFFSIFEGSVRGGGSFYLKVRGTPESAIASVRTAVAQIDPRLPLLALRSFDDQVKRGLTNERMLATLSAGFGIIALLLSAVGLYGVLSFVVTSRTREIGIRLALGATRLPTVWRVVRDAAVMVGAAAAIALPCIWTLSRLVRAQLFGIDAIDGPTIAAACVVLGLIALAGALVPAWRAASVKPTEALRSE